MHYDQGTRECALEQNYDTFLYEIGQEIISKLSKNFVLDLNYWHHVSVIFDLNYYFMNN
jgi:hypothetical protein